MIPGGLAAGGADETGRRTGVGMTTGRNGIGTPFFFFPRRDIESLSQVGQQMPCVTAFADIYQNMIDLAWESGMGGVGLAGFEERSAVSAVWL